MNEPRISYEKDGLTQNMKLVILINLKYETRAPYKKHGLT